MLQRFIQSQCLILQLKVAYKSASVPNEAMVQQALTWELQKLGNVLYSRSNAAAWQKSFNRSQPHVDLVVSNKNLDALSNVLFNLRGLTLPVRGRNPQTPAFVDPFLSLKDYESLQELFEELKSVWVKNEHRRRSGSRDLEPFTNIGPWCFKSTPVSQIKTSAATSLETPPALYTKEESTESDGQSHGSRFFDFSRWQPKHEEDVRLENKPEVEAFFEYAKGQLATDARHVYLEPVLYSDFDSLPRELQEWMDDSVTDSTLTQPDSEDETRRLDFLLHGFKGFDK
ncbi:LAFA_0D07272g1_1 [Lachancea sp. 'fantastica']|nr:LAFA_0D07272g1_1 [Lachancea sp. 'fantastica']